MVMYRRNFMTILNKTLCVSVMSNYYATLNYYATPKGLNRCFHLQAKTQAQRAFIL